MSSIANNAGSGGSPDGLNKPTSIRAKLQSQASKRVPVVTIPFSVKLFSGAVGGIVGTGAIYPVDMVKTRLQASDKGMYRGFFDAGRKILAELGPRGMYRGLIPNIVGVAPEKGTRMQQCLSFSK